MIVTSDIVFPNLKLNKIGDIIESTRLEHDNEYCFKRFRKIEVISNVNFLNKIKNKTKNISFNSYCVK